MHELSIIQNILDIAESEARKNNATRITKIKLKIGEMSGVLADSIHSCFDTVKRNTIACDAELLIEHIPLTGRCRDCGINFLIDGYQFVCSACNSNKIEIISGKELLIDELEVE